jgi:hypothetical protein
MAPAQRNKLLVAGLAVVAMLAVAGSFLYGAKKKGDLESSAAASVADATARLRADDTGAAQLAALQANLDRLRAEEASRNKALAEAAELYLIETQAILRNRANAARALAATRASTRALAAHLENSAARGTGWIQRALELKGKAERDSFDYRTALAALAALYDAHRETQAKLQAAAPGAPLLSEDERMALLKATRAAEAKAGEELERLRRLPIG